MTRSNGPPQRHKTVSIPPWAHAKLDELLQLITARGVSPLPDELQALVQQHQDETKRPVLTHGLVFGLAVEYALHGLYAEEKP